MTASANELSTERSVLAPSTWAGVLWGATSGKTWLLVLMAVIAVLTYSVYSMACTKDMDKRLVRLETQIVEVSNIKAQVEANSKILAENALTLAKVEEQIKMFKEGQGEQNKILREMLEILKCK